MSDARRIDLAASICLVLAGLGLLLWTPVLLNLSAVTGADAGDASLSPARRAAELVRAQYGAGIWPVAMGLMWAYALISLVQFPAALGALARRAWGMRLLFSLCWIKMIAYALGGVLLGVAILLPGGSAREAGLSIALDVSVVIIYFWLYNLLRTPALIAADTPEEASPEEPAPETP